MKTKSFIASLMFLTFLTNSLIAYEKFGNLLQCPIIDITDGRYDGQSFLNFIQETVRPELNQFAIKGYPITDGERLVESLELVDSKVKRQVIKSLKGKHKSDKISNLQYIGDKLEGQNTNLHTLPGMIRSTGQAKDIYTLSTYIGLVSCGGSSLKLADDNYAYNIHYGTGKEKTDKLTGRSFGASRIYHATDSSYSHYLRTLECYVRKTPDNVKGFVSTIMETLTNTQPRDYDMVNDYGDAVLTDFFAIWTAEQTRNLMDGKVDLHWDAALLQVTLLSAFHAGQDKIKLFYKEPKSGKFYFTDTTFTLAWPRKNHASETCDVDFDSRKFKNADFKDYIGVHYATYKHCGRSGVNMSRNEWKRLSREITTYLMSSEEGRKKVQNVRKYIDDVVDLTKNERGKKYRDCDKDVLRELARFLINDKTPSKIKNWYQLSKNTAELLEYIRKHASEITMEIEQKYTQQIR